MILATRQLALALFGRSAPAGWTRPADFNTLKVCLYTVAPADDGTGGTEYAGSGYAPVAITVNDANFGIAGDVVSNIAEIQFPLLTGALAEFVAVVIKDNADVIRWVIPAGLLPVNFTGAAAGDTLTKTAHGFTDGLPMRGKALADLGLPGNLVADTTYFTRDTTANTLKLAATLGGAAIDLSSDGVIALRRWYGKSFAIDDRPVIPAGFLQFKLAA